MKSVLVLAEHPAVAEAVRAGLSPEQYRVLHRRNPDEGEPLLVHGLADVCLVDVELTGVTAVWVTEKVRRFAPKCPIIIYSSTIQAEWEEEVYLKGAAYVLPKPVRPRTLAVLLDRLLSPSPKPQPYPAPSTALQPAEISPPISSGAGPPLGSPSAGGLVRDFSRLFSQSLNTDGLLNQFLLLLREVFGLNRGAIFLRQSGPGPERSGQAPEFRQLRAVCSVGLSSALLENARLSLDSGIGAQLLRMGRMLRRHGEEARTDPETLREFELFGAQVAVPIMDRETLLGAALLDSRITGESLANPDLELIFHLLEPLALAVKNIWLHEQLAGNHEMMAGILRELHSACVVVDADLIIQHANKTARRYFATRESHSGELEFADLPQPIGAKIYQVLKTGSGLANFRYEPQQPPGAAYNVSIVPFQRPHKGLPLSALLIMDDLTQSEQLRRLELEAANLRLVKKMADRLTHEMGNAMVRPNTYQQLLNEKLSRKGPDPDFLRLMARDFEADIRRVDRLVNQMRYLNSDAPVSQETFPVAPLLEEAYQEACKNLPAKPAKLVLEGGQNPVVISGDRKALLHAFSEVMLNALQANPADPKLAVELHAEPGGNGKSGLEVEVRDNGSGFTADAAQKAFEPFFTTRNVGLGLGLTVSRKVIGTHHGKLEILPAKPGWAGGVRISLPLPKS